MKSENSDLYINILRYAYKKSEGFTLIELKKDLSLGDEHFAFLWNDLHYSKLFTKTNKYRIPNNQDWNNEVLLLSFEGRFKLVEYDQLEEAKESGKKATIIAIIAILISIAVAFYQIVIPQEVVVKNSPFMYFKR